MSNPLVKLILVVMVVLGGGFFAMRTYRHKMTEYEHRLDLERIRREYLERAPVARALADPARAQDEQRALWKWYFTELAEHYNRYGKFKNYDRFLDELDSRKSGKKVKDQEYVQYAERYKLTKAMWDLLREGKPDPVFVAQDRGLRFDVFRVEPVPGGKEPTLKVWVSLMGAQRRWVEEQLAGGPRLKRLTVNATFQKLVVRGFDAAGKQLVEMPVTGEPFKVDNPERFIDEFPPSFAFGFYALPMLPAEVDTAEFEFVVSTRSVLSGEEVGGTFVWKTPLKAEWKLAPGLKWEGATEEMREPDPADKGKAPAGKSAKR